jgi:hypothetical protein
MVLNATFNNISVIWWRSVLLVEETGGPGENHRPVVSHWKTMFMYTSPWSRFQLTTLVVIGTHCIGSCKSNYHTITAKTTPHINRACPSLNVCIYVITLTLTVSNVLNTIFNNNSIILLQSVLWMEDTTVLKENHQPARSHWQTPAHLLPTTPVQSVSITTIVVSSNSAQARFTRYNIIW